MPSFGPLPEVQGGLGFPGVEGESSLEGRVTRLERFLNGIALRRERASSATSVNDSTATTIPLNSEVKNTAGEHMTYASSTLTINVPGWYALSGGIRWAANATGYRGCGLLLDATDYITHQRSTPDGAVNFWQTCSTVVYLDRNAAITLTGIQTSGGALNANADRGTFLSAIYLGA